MPLLYYIRYWARDRCPTVSVVLTPKFDFVKKLARNICPETEVICPDGFFSRLMVNVFGVAITRRFAFSYIYCFLLRNYPEAVFLHDLNKHSKSNYTKYLDDIFRNHATQSPFWEGYVNTRRVFDCKFDAYFDFLKFCSDGRHRVSFDEERIQSLKDCLGISDKYVVLNVNTRDYSPKYANFRRIFHHERYNTVIDYLTEKGYVVVLQGTDEQPKFAPRRGFVDYARSPYRCPENDLLLFAGCEFFVSSKSGAENYGLVCDKPVLGLNYTELCAMQPNPRLRFFPKHVKDGLGRFLPWQEILEHPVYFQLGGVLSVDGNFEFVEMEEQEIIAALEEFLELVPLPRDKWLCYTPRQQDFKQRLHPKHLDLYYISGVPCDAYLRE
jgi:putative glycosyltransferase (TIGR04372 family)